jgi:hypothetical protein
VNEIESILTMINSGSAQSKKLLEANECLFPSH